MNDTQTDRNADGAAAPSRRSLLLNGLGLTAASLLPPVAARAETGAGQTTDSGSVGRRKLGALEVSSVGLGVQNTSRTYQTTIPTRA